MYLIEFFCRKKIRNKKASTVSFSAYIDVEISSKNDYTKTYKRFVNLIFVILSTLNG